MNGGWNDKIQDANAVKPETNHEYDTVYCIKQTHLHSFSWKEHMR